MKELNKTIVAVTAFCIAMAALESAVVVYLRALYYPGEFTVALKLIDQKILLVELAREAATIIMLFAIGFLAGKNFKSRFAFFLLSFAVWDIFYYVWLKVFISWPASFFEWDILFLIPVTWLGPVLAPVICSLTMIGISVWILCMDDESKIQPITWWLWIAGSIMILFTFMEDYGTIIIANGFWKDYANIMSNKQFLAITSSYIPAYYNWPLFLMGEILTIGGTLNLIAKKDQKKLELTG